MSSSNEDLVSVICGACSSGRPVVEIGQALAQLVPAGFESGRARIALALRQAAALIGAEPAQLPALLALSFELSRANLCGNNAPFVLIEDILAARTVDELADVFDLIEHFIGVLAQEILVQSDAAQSQRAKLSLLRICNTLLGRLPKTQDMAFRGRVLILLAKCFPIDERSGVNLKAAFNTANITILEAEKPPDDSEVAIDFNFYRVFWSVQAYLSNPRQLAENQAQVDFMKIVDAIITAFEGNPLSSLDVDAALDPSDDNADSGFNAKYLTAPRLFPLQLRDPQLRRTVLLQLLIIFDFLLQTPPCKRVQIPVTIQRRLELSALQERITQAIESTPPNGPEFLAAVRDHLKSEVSWSNWKDEGCPAMQNTNIDKTDHDKGPAITIRPALIPMGVTNLNKLWNLDVDITSPKRNFESNSKELIEELVEEDDPEAGIEDAYKKKNDVRWCWKALRTLIRTDLNIVCECEGDFDKIVKRSAPPPPAPSPAVAPVAGGPAPSPHVAPPAPMPILEVPEFCSAPAQADRSSLPTPSRPVIKRRPMPVETSVPAEVEDGALEETPTKRQKTASAMNEQLQEQIALERAKKHAHDEEIRARRTSRFERKDFNPGTRR